MYTNVESLHIEMGRRLVGGTMQVFYLVRNLHRMGYPVSLICPKNSPLDLKASEVGIDVCALPYIGELDIRFPFMLRSTIKKKAPDIIHIHSRRGADTLGLLTARAASNAKVVLTRRIDNPIKKNPINWLRYQKMPHHVIAVSYGIKNVIIKSGAASDDISVVHSAIDASSYQVDSDVNLIRKKLSIPENAKVICTIAQLIERKGHQYLFQAAKQILNRFPECHFLLLGEGEFEAKLKKLAHSLRIENKVIFAGYRNNVGEILNIVDILVHPPTMEGFANVALQAMAASVPVVSTAVGGMPESVRDGVNGLLVPPRDPDKLSEAVVKLLENPETMKNYGKKGKKIVEQEFTVDKMVEGNLLVYQHLLNTTKT